MRLARIFLLAFFIGGASWQTALADCTAPAAPQPASAAKPSPNDPAALSAGFWADWKKAEASESYTALKAAVGKANTGAAPVGPVNTQRIVDVAISTPADAAKVLTDATAASNDAISTKALSTVVNMITSPKTREEAAPLVAPEAQERVVTMTANLSTGIQGLPGIYLGDNAVANGGERQPAPAGYAPVSGGSAGCPTR